MFATHYYVFFICNISTKSIPFLRRESYFSYNNACLVLPFTLFLDLRAKSGKLFKCEMP